MQRIKSKRVQLLVVFGNVLLFVCSIGFIGVPQTQAATQGCEHNPVSGHAYQCAVTGAQPCLNERDVHSPTIIEACLPNGATVYVVKQIRLKNPPISGSAIWDVLRGGDSMVSDNYLNTSNHGKQFSPPIAQDSTPTATPPGGNAGRFFSDTSPWNALIGPNVTLDPNSGSMVHSLANGLHVPAMFAFGMPIYYSSVSDPSYTVQDPGNDALFSKDQPIHIPDSAAPSPGSDHWLFIYDKTKNVLFEMWNTQKRGNTWTTQTGNVYDPNGDGVLQTDGSVQSGNGASYWGGVITAADMERGSIDHALSLASEDTSSAFRYPMSASDGGHGTIPMGARFQLNPAVKCNALPGASTGEKMVCRALQEYGGYMRDTGGVSLSLYFEGENLNDPSRNPPDGSPGNTGLSSGVFGKVGLQDSENLSAIPWHQLRVLKAWNSYSS